MYGCQNLSNVQFTKKEGGQIYRLADLLQEVR